MKVAIIEDENLASAYLKNILERQQLRSIEHIIQLSSIKESIQYFAHHKVDLIFMDIHLGDGKSLEIFEQVTIDCPIIFITAFDSYALKTFKQFTIDYILKPFEEEQVLQALHKFNSLSKHFNSQPVLDQITKAQNTIELEPKQRFLVQNGYKLKSIDEKDIAYFAASGKHLFLHTQSEEHYIYQDTIKDLIEKLDTHHFFRINRKYIVHHDAIVEIIKHSSQKIELKLSPSPKEEETILISKTQIPTFKIWLNR